MSEIDISGGMPSAETADGGDTRRGKALGCCRSDRPGGRETAEEEDLLQHQDSNTHLEPSGG